MKVVASKSVALEVRPCDMVEGGKPGVMSVGLGSLAKYDEWGARGVFVEQGVEMLYAPSSWGSMLAPTKEDGMLDAVGDTSATA